MRLATRMILTLMLALAGAGLAAQESTPAEETSTVVTTEEANMLEQDGRSATAEDPEIAVAEQSEESAEESATQLRRQFGDLLLQHPYNVATVIAYDPTLLNNQQFLERYPEIARFVESNPEISRNPSFYMANFTHRTQTSSVLESILEPIMIFAVFVLIAYALAWLIGTIIEQKRWNRLSKTQTEVHNKILDRFGTTDELLNYVKSPAGAKFLEAAPIPVHSDKPAAQSAPVTRVLWSVQLGVVVAIGSIGMLLVSFRLPDQSGDELFAFGLIAFCVGVGFIGSAAVSLILSQRLGLWEPRPSHPESSIDPGIVR